MAIDADILSVQLLESKYYNNSNFMEVKRHKIMIFMCSQVENGL